MVDCQDYMIYVMSTIAGISTPPIPQPHRAANLDNHKLSRLAATALPLDNQPLHVSLASLREARSTWSFIDLEKKERERTQAGFGPNYFLKEKQYKCHHLIE